jgi:hypothetical protein
MRSLTLALLVTMGCFDPGQPSLICSADRPLCPEGLVCIADMCQQSSVSDASSTDAFFNDLSSSDLSLPAGCAAGNGQRLGTNGCWLCPGQFGSGSNPTAPAMCSPSHMPPINSGLISEIDCFAVTGGFFVANVYGATKYNDATMSECGKFTTSGLNPGYFGCGVGTATVNANVACNSFRKHIQCIVTNGIKCTDGTLANLSNSVSTNGVICCPK